LDVVVHAGGPGADAVAPTRYDTVTPFVTSARWHPEDVGFTILSARNRTRGCPPRANLPDPQQPEAMTANEPPPAATPAATNPAAKFSNLDAGPAESVIIRPWPKVVFLYPTFVAAAIFFLLSWLRIGDAEGQLGSKVLGNTFMVVLVLNLLVFSFDFSRIKSITILISVVTILLLVGWLDQSYDVTGFLGRVFGSIDIRMNTAFYGFFAAGLGVLLAIVWINSRFNYYEVNAREILHHHGYLGDIQRWSTEGLEMNKEIYDLAEYILMRSGRLIFHPATSKKAIVLDNVAQVNRIEKSINDLLSVVAVRFNQRPGPG
jgi:hypothetical protein